MNWTRMDRARRLLTVLAVLIAVPATSAEAARPPMGRTYLTVAVGLDTPYSTQQQCFEFLDGKLCSLDGLICGSWHPVEELAPEISFDFDLSAIVEGELMRLEGRGRAESAGRMSSIAGTGLFQPADGKVRGVNFSFAGREIGKEECLERLGDADDDEVVTGSGNPVTEEREVGPFNALAANGVGRIEIRHGATESLFITADDNLLPILTSEVRDLRLILGSTERFSTRNGPLYEVTLRRLDEILLAGVFGVDAAGINTDSLDVNVSGVSVITASGSARHQSVIVAGVSRYDARDVSSRTVEIDVSGPSSAVVRVSDRLEGHLTGGAVLEYIGNPIIDVTVDFTSTLRKIG